MSDAQPGWYDDGHGQLRWWDGAAWTEHVSALAPAVTSAPAHPTRRKGAPAWVWIVSGLAVLSISLVAIVVAVVVATRTPPFKEAEAALHTYDLAWLNTDCALLKEATTQTLRDDWGYDDCTEFVRDAKEFREADKNYRVTINSSTFDDGAVIVKTTENYDDNGPVEDHVTYTVIQEGDAWRIDSIDFEDDRTDTSTNA